MSAWVQAITCSGEMFFRLRWYLGLLSLLRYLELLGLLRLLAFVEDEVKVGG